MKKWWRGNSWLQSTQFVKKGLENSGNNKEKEPVVKNAPKSSEFVKTDAEDSGDSDVEGKVMVMG